MALERPLASVLDALHARIPLGMRLGLDAMRAGSANQGNPERAFDAVHVAGTNGKGSVCAMVESIARAHGLHTGLYTSPHLNRFAERIRIDGQPIADAALARALATALGEEPELSFFEAATLAAFLVFREEKVDVAVVEVGLGGRLDATNVLPTPRAAAITRIAMDHADRLGESLVQIAREKAGIAKPGLELVLGPMSPEIRQAIDDVARAQGATTRSPPAWPASLPIGLDGAHQRDNAGVAAALGARLGATWQAIETGVASVRWPARLERIDRYLLDAAHNPDGAQALADHVRSLSIAPDRVGLVFGALADKDWRAMLSILAPLAESRVFMGPSAAARTAVDPALMAREVGGEAAESIGAALSAVRGDLVIVAGSLFLVGAARAALLGLKMDPAVAL